MITSRYKYCSIVFSLLAIQANIEQILSLPATAKSKTTTITTPIKPIDLQLHNGIHVIFQ